MELSGREIAWDGYVRQSASIFVDFRLSMSIYWMGG